MPVTWTVTPEDMLSQLADVQAKAIYQFVHALAVEYAPQIQDHMNASIPWHGGEPDISDDEPNDMVAWVEEVVNQMVIIYLSHDEMANPEKTLEKELAYVPPALDYFGPRIMSDIRSALGG